MKRHFIRDAASSASLLIELSLEDLKSGYKESLAGNAWILIRPAVTVAVYFIVFQFFLRPPAGTVGAPYAIWFLGGMLPWLCFAETLSAGTRSYREYSYLVRKISFPIRMIPLIKIFSGFIIHLYFLLFLCTLCIFCNQVRRISIAGFLYAAACLLIYTGLSAEFCSVIYVFFHDVSDLTGLFLQAGIWAAPILWDFQKVPAACRPLFALNPMFHIVLDYRLALGCQDGTALWGISFAAFWGHCVLLGAVSEYLFRVLRPHISDLL